VSPSLASLAVVLAVASPGVVDIELPVVDLNYETASLDESVRTSESSKQVQVTLAADVLFRFDKAALSPRAKARLADVSERISQADPSRVKIDGYTDSKGSDAYNLGLSRRRAAAVAVALRGRLSGAGPRLVTRGHGEADPVAANTRKNGSDNPKGRARNRRVTITFPR
jgi:outer membrane protein OmpA-like peptidoglycan-associated protein